MAVGLAAVRGEDGQLAPCLFAVLGPSGAGKTTFMDILSGRKRDAGEDPSPSPCRLSVFYSCTMDACKCRLHAVLCCDLCWAGLCWAVLCCAGLGWARLG